MAASLDRVVCLTCSEKILMKNLKTHYLRHHPGISVKYKSATSENIGTFFSDVSKKKKPNEIEEGNIVEGEASWPSTSFEQPNPNQIQKLLDKVTGK